MEQERKTELRGKLTYYRLGLPTLIIIGTFLIAVNSYSTLLTLYAFEIAVRLLEPLFHAHVAGIALVIVGATLYTRSIGPSISPLRRPYLIAGETMLTISVFGDIVRMLLPMLMLEYPYSLHSLLVALFRTAGWGWLTPMIWAIGCAGWLILLIERITRPKSPRPFRLLRWSEWALALGAVIFLTSLFLYTSERLLAVEATLPPYEPSFICTFYFACVHPLGALSLTFGWATKTSIHLSKHPILLLALYTAFLVATATLFLIPI